MTLFRISYLLLALICSARVSAAEQKTKPEALSYETAHEMFRSYYFRFHKGSKSGGPAELIFGSCSDNAVRFLKHFKNHLVERGVSEEQHQKFFQRLNLRVQIFLNRCCGGYVVHKDIEERFVSCPVGWKIFQETLKYHWGYHVYFVTDGKTSDEFELVFDLSRDIGMVSREAHFADLFQNDEQETSKSKDECLIGRVAEFSPEQYLRLRANTSSFVDIIGHPQRETETFAPYDPLYYIVRYYPQKIPPSLQFEPQFQGDLLER